MPADERQRRTARSGCATNHWDTAGLRKPDDLLERPFTELFPPPRRGRETRDSSPPHLYLLYRASKARQREYSDRL
jgi:hypothetical protein